MPYGKEFLSAKDIKIILDVSRSSAYDIMHMFLQSGRGIKIGMTYRVRSEIFYAWHSPNVILYPVRQFKTVRGGNGDATPGVKKDFLKAYDIMKILSIGHTKALEVLRGLIQEGRALQYGRVYRVSRDVFYDWLAEMDGYRPDRKLSAM